MEEHKCLISVMVFSRDGEKILKEICKQFKSDFDLIKCSDVYLVKGKHSKSETLHDIVTEDSYIGLSMSFAARTVLEPELALKFLENIELLFKNPAQKRTVSLNLLAFDDNTKMTPRLVLPHPSLHLQPELLVPAADVWPEYYHPVLKQSLIGLLKGVQTVGWGEFYAPAKSVLDFSN